MTGPGRGLCVSQDGAGSKSAFLTKAGELWRQARKLADESGGPPVLLLLDRCHATAEARAEALACLGLPHHQVGGGALVGGPTCLSGTTAALPCLLQVLTTGVAPLCVTAFAPGGGGGAGGRWRQLRGADAAPHPPLHPPLQPQQRSEVRRQGNRWLCLARIPSNTSLADALPLWPTASAAAGERERARKLVEGFQGRLSFPSSTADREGFKRVHRLSNAGSLPAFVRELLLSEATTDTQDDHKKEAEEEEVLSLLHQDVARHSQRPRGGGPMGRASEGPAPLIKFPRTRHLCGERSGVSRDDLVLGERERDALFLDGHTTITIEEVGQPHRPTHTSLAHHGRQRAMAGSLTD